MSADEFEVVLDGYFAILPEWVLYAEISDRAVRLYAVLRRYAGDGLQKARPSRQKLADRMYTSLSSIDRALRELQAIGAVTVRNRWTNPALSSFSYIRDEDHQVRASNSYLLHHSPPRSIGGVVTGDATPRATRGNTSRGVVTGDDTVSSPVTRGVQSPVTHETEPVDPKPEGERRAADSAAIPAGTAPPSSCPKHPNGTPESCGACGWHRRHHEAWVAERDAAEEAARLEVIREQARQRDAAEAREKADAIAACRECDARGYRDGERCDHRRRTLGARKAATAAFRAHQQSKAAQRPGKPQRRPQRPTDLTPPVPVPIPGVTD